MEDVLLGHWYKCVECGKSFYVDHPGAYTYKVSGDYCCDYNCYDHALLRREASHNYYYDMKKLLKFISQSEAAMTHRNKRILNPIDTSKILARINSQKKNKLSKKL